MQFIRGVVQHDKSLQESSEDATNEDATNTNSRGVSIDSSEHENVVKECVENTADTEENADENETDDADADAQEEEDATEEDEETTNLISEPEADLNEESESSTEKSNAAAAADENADADATPPPQAQSEKDSSSVNTNTSGSDASSSYATEAEAISNATKAADENYQPSQSHLSSSSPYPLIRSVDGISLKTYNPEPSRFSAKDVVIPLRGSLDVPIHVTASGSVVDYKVESKDFDIGFGVKAEREEGVTVVKEKTRQNSHLDAITGRFLVGSVPCALVFSFDNEYSWFREKKISYKIKVSPPTVENIIQGRRTRAQSALDVVQSDKESAETRLEGVSSKYGTLIQDIERLETELAEKKKTLGVVEKEEGWLKQRVQLREIQESLLTRRLVEGWEDEVVEGEKTGDGDAEDNVQRAEI